MAYTTIDDPGLFFNTVLYTGNGGSQTITGVGFQPDFVWFKTRDGTHAHALVDSVRGTDKVIHSNTTQAEQSISSQTFNSDGYALVADGTANSINSSGSTKVAWNWKAGTAFTNDASGTGIGSIDSAGSVNNDSGFSIVSYTGTGSAGTIKHGLGSVPKMIIIRRRTGSTTNWIVYHESIGNNNELYLNTTAVSTSSTRFQSTSPTSSVFSVSSNSAVNESSQSIIAYCFAEKQGYSKFGSYTGNGNADGTFVYTGFKPAFVMFKGNNISDWQLWDNKRDTYNPVEKALHPDISNTASTDQDIDFLSNGFKIRGSVAHINGSGVAFYYMAIAENPFVTSSGVPATAR